jgi:predicted CoA-binding protein
MPQRSDLIVILGLSDDPQRYSHMAMKLLQQEGYENIIGVHPNLKPLDAVKVLPRLEDVPARPHTVTVYLSPEKSAALIPSLVALKPQRIILNPGTESSQLTQAARDKGIAVEEACTLVLLRTRQF